MNNNLTQHNDARYEMLATAKEKYPVLHGLNFDILLISSDDEAAVKLGKAFHTLVEGINKHTPLAKNAVLCFIQGGISDNDAPSIKLTIFYTHAIEVTELNNTVERGYNEIYKILGEDGVHVQSFFDAMSTEFLDYLKQPYSTDVHSEVGFEYFNNVIMLNPNLNHLCHGAIKFTL